MNATDPSCALEAPEPAAPDVLAGGGELGALMRGLDWSQTPLGPPEGWPQSLRTAVRIMLTSRQPIWIGWGPALTYLYNDAYRSIIGGKHPQALGRPTAEVWREIWDDEMRGPIEDALAGSDGIYVEENLLVMERNGYPEETYYTYSFSPIPDDEGRPGGIICANTDDTSRVIGERQLKLLGELGARTTGLRTVPEACARACEALGTNGRDLPFTLLYMLGRDGPRLCGTSGIGRDHPAAAGEGCPWPLAEALASEEALVVPDLAERLGAGLPGGAWPRPPQAAALLPVRPGGEGGPQGVLVVGLSPFRLFDEGYEGFLRLASGQVAAAIGAALSFEEEARRAAALAELDHAKTRFFSNVSHEFRTPLTLMLSPLEAALDRLAGDVESRGLLELAHRNALRLLKLVNALLDFTRLEAGRAEARLEALDLAALTADLAADFAAATEGAGLRLDIDCPPLPGLVLADREMWEKIVLNLLSNAFKFTFEGGIAVSLAEEDGRAVLRVRDTGTGIPAAELPRLFDRFHRIEGQRSRSFEGSGIGLALVRELVRLHGGDIEVESVEGQGTTVAVSLPLGSARSPLDQLPPRPAPVAPAPTLRATAFVTEAMGWLGAEDLPPEAQAAPLLGARGRARLLVVDDSADMRAYLRRLLDGSADLRVAADGEEALAAIREDRPDLVVSDAMMPRLDGFGLLREVRADPALRGLPVILLSARAGEEARVEGLDAGASDYLTKPFAARELLARVRAALDLARARGEAEAVLRAAGERKAFLADLSDALRGQDDAAGIARTAAERLGRHLDAARCGFAEADPEGQRVTVAEDWTDGRHPSVAGVHRIDDFGRDLAGALRSGRTVAVGDVASADGIDPRDLASYAALGVRAHVAAPVFRASGLAALLFVHADRPRGWSEAEADLVREVAERTYAALEAARAGRALRESETFTRRILDASNDCIKVLDLEGRLQFMSGGGLRVMELDDFAALHHRNWSGIWPEAERPKVEAAVARAREGGVGSFRGYAPTARGNLRYWDVVVSPIPDDQGRVASLLSISRDITAQRRAEESLRESEARFRSMADSAPVMIWTTDAEGACTYVNRQWHEVTGRPRAEAMGRGYLSAIHPDDLSRTEGVARMAQARREPYRIEYRMSDAEGGEAWVIDTAQPRMAADGAFLGYIGSVIDITERKRAEEGRVLLINELNHRVKNTLATVQSLASQSFRLGRVDPAVREAFEARLMSLSRAHDVLTQEQWEGAPLREIVRRALAPFGAGEAGGRFALRGPQLRVAPRMALSIAMALHELATNAAKYGALSRPEGRVALDWKVLPAEDGAPRRLAMSWREEGGPPVAPPVRQGFGTRLVGQGLAAELGGEVDLEFHATGVACHIVAPLDGERRDDG